MIKAVKRKFVLASMIAITAMLVFLLGVINVVNIVSTGSEISNMMDALVYTNREVFFGLDGLDSSGFIEYSVEIDENTEKKDSDADDSDSDVVTTGPEINQNIPGSGVNPNVIDYYIWQGAAQDYVPDSSADDEDSSNSQSESASAFDERFRSSRFGFFMTPLTENVYESAVYFIVMMDEDGNFISADIENVPSESAESAYNLAYELYCENKTGGRTGSYRYESYTSAQTAPASSEADAVYNVSSEDETLAEEQSAGRVVYIFLDTSTDLYGVFRVLIMSLIAGVAVWGLMFLLVILLSNKMIRPVAENMERQKEFVTSAGHEIKTPLAIIQSNTEALELFNGSSKWTANIKEQTARLTGLMQNLLALSKADDTYDKPEIEQLDMTALVRKYINMFDEPAARRSLLIIDNVMDDVTVQGEPARIGLLISVLLDNAVKYAKEGGKIYIDLFTEGRMSVLRLKNTCSELPDCDPERLFDRFYRPESDRSSETGGSGIGLSAARAVCETFSGSISAAYDESDIIFTVTLIN